MLAWHLARAVGIIAALCFIAFPMSAHTLAIWISVLLATALVVVYRLDYLNPFVLFSISWIIILFFSAQDISDYSREINKETIFVVASGLLVGLIFIPPEISSKIYRANVFVDPNSYAWCRATFLALSIINILVAGYIPLISLFTEGDSRYMEFGLKGLYGLFNAFANAFGVFAFYLWLNERRKKYLLDTIICTLIFILFVSRQNVISLFFECFVVYCLLRGRPSASKTASLIAAVVLLFSVAGNARVSQDISELAQIKQEYLWIPTPVVWIFSYSYFNILNLDNLVSARLPPKLDGSSLHQLIPSFLRPDDDDASNTLEAAQFNVQSYLHPIYQDFGNMGVLFFVAIACLAIGYHRKKLKTTGKFHHIGSYSVMLFCFLFSFFVNFWFYLPIIFQIFFFFIFSRFILLSPQKKIDFSCSIDRLPNPSA
jgi:oligosaccharide repeat unit polymerase